MTEFGSGVVGDALVAYLVRRIEVTKDIYLNMTTGDESITNVYIRVTRTITYIRQNPGSR